MDRGRTPRRRPAAAPAEVEPAPPGSELPPATGTAADETALRARQVGDAGGAGAEREVIRDSAAPAVERESMVVPEAEARAPALGERTEEVLLDEGERRIELHEERLVPRKELREVGEVVIRTEVEEAPARLEVDAYREEVEVERVPVGEIVRKRRAPWQEGDVLVVPVYEEQIVAVKRLVLREHLRIRRVGLRERRRFEDTVRRERVVVEDPQTPGLVMERYPAERTQGEALDRGRERKDLEADAERADAEAEEGGFFHHLVRKALQ